MAKFNQIIFASTLCFITTALGAVVQNNDMLLEIRILKIQKNKGRLVVDIYRDKGTWLDKPYAQRILSTEQEQAVVSLMVPAGTYAISIYQDINSNGKLDSNFLNVPKEPIGFGNNYRPFGPPKYSAASVVVGFNSQPQVVELFEAF